MIVRLNYSLSTYYVLNSEFLDKYHYPPPHTMQPYREGIITLLVDKDALVIYTVVIFLCFLPAHNDIFNCPLTHLRWSFLVLQICFTK